VAQFPEFCFQSYGVQLPHSGDAEATSQLEAYIGLGTSGKLHITHKKSAYILASNTTSFTIASSFIIYTTTAHEATFVPLSSLCSFLIASEDGLKPSTADWETRRVERGSKIVTAVPSSMSLVLQMPRGNLETINPRPLVMEVVKQDLDVYVVLFSLSTLTGIKL
jgi:elongator complex protein 1